MDPELYLLLSNSPGYLGWLSIPLVKKSTAEPDAAPFVVIIDLGVGQLGSPCGVIKDLMVHWAKVW